MKIKLNNNEEIFEGATLSVSRMLEEKKYSFKLRIIKVNGTLIQREKYESTFLCEGDDVQLIYLMSGG
jgi:thiamine biosynthesis protein ThiS